MVAVSMISSRVKRRGTSASGMWMVTGTTARSSDQIIITGLGAGPPSAASAARNSVWPGKAKPAWYITDFAMGLVTTAPARPAVTSATAVSMAARAAGALAASGRPGAAVAGWPVASTGTARGKSAAASSGVAGVDRHVEAEQAGARRQRGRVADDQERRQPAAPRAPPRPGA